MKDAANQYQSYMKGWAAGAWTRAMDLRFTEHEDLKIVAAYNTGYAEGCASRQAATLTASAKYDYRPSVLRLAQPRVRKAR